MPRTFSLAGLMIGVTLIGLACGCAVNFPYNVRFEIGVLTPTLVPSLILFRLAKHRGLSLCIALLGYLYGFIIWSTIENSQRWFVQIGFEVVVRNLIHALQFLLPGSLAFVATGSYIFGESCLLSSKNKQPQLHAEALQSVE